MAWTSEQAAAYAAANPDVWKSYQNDSQNKGLTLQQAMEGHYNNFGQTEGRAAPTASQEYSTQNLSPYISAGIQNSTKAYDLNGNPITLGAGQRVTGGALNGNVIYNADGTSAGNYYTSPEDAARAKAQVQTSMNSGAVAGPQTLDQQRQTLQNTLNTGGISSPGGGAPGGGGGGTQPATPGGTPNTSGGGLVGNYMSNFSSTAGQATTTPWNVTNDQTVLGQMQKVTADNSPLIQSARTGALQQANSRGLINSSLALGAADLAAYEVALPIAQADAGMYGNAAKTNAAAENSTSQFNASAANALQTANLSADTQKALQAMSGENALKVAELNKQYSQQLQGSQSAATLYRNYSDQIMAIYQDTNMSDVAKQNAVDNLTNTFATGLSLISSIDKIDLTAFLS